METLIHILGVCPDSVAHLDLRDILASIGPELSSNIFRLITFKLKLFFTQG